MRCLDYAQVKRTTDTITTLHGRLRNARREAGAATVSLLSYKQAWQATDSAASAQRARGDELRRALVSERIILARQQGETEKYRHRAHRKGVLNALLLVLAGSLSYLLVAK